MSEMEQLARLALARITVNGKPLVFDGRTVTRATAILETNRYAANVPSEIARTVIEQTDCPTCNGHAFFDLPAPRHPCGDCGGTGSTLLNVTRAAPPPERKETKP